MMKIQRFMVALLAVTALGIGLAATGCNKGDSTDFDTGIAGYQCMKCGHKFMTDPMARVDACPKCGHPNPVNVRKYACSKCDWSQLSPDIGDNMPCGSCGKPVDRFLPVTRGELEEWGAVWVDIAE